MNNLSLVLKAITLTFFFILTNFSHAQSRCYPEEGHDYLYEEDFPWNQSLEDILNRADALYRSPKRLIDRAYRSDEGLTLIPIRMNDGKTKTVRTSEVFIKSVTRHVEEAFKRRYIDALLFSDMGHSHFFIPQKYYDEVIDKIAVENKHILYEKILNHPGLKILYHTAEQLTMLNENREILNNRHIQWRFFTRNLVGDNEGLGKLELLHNEPHRYNTAHDYDEGYRYWGGGFYISAHENGCFPFTVNGETRYFDLNLEGINNKTP